MRSAPPMMLDPTATMEQYASHVNVRVKLFFVVLGRAIKKVLEAGGTVRQSLFFDTADAQIQSGKKGDKQNEVIRGDQNYDAAHYVNTTLNTDEMQHAMGSNVDGAAINEIYEMTAATSTQFKTANTSSDKVIDKVMTYHKNQICQQVKSSGTWGESELKGAVSNFLNETLLQLSGRMLKVGSGPRDALKRKAYQTAITTITEINENAMVRDIIADI
ncbi:MAG: hypothetical protein ACFB2W_00320 [Leptolyngbyaceae cyanobacterium]